MRFIALVFALLFISPAYASIEFGSQAKVLKGPMTFCQNNPDDCRVIGGTKPMKLTAKRYTQLEAVQSQVNFMLKPQPEPYGVDIWQMYPEDGYGDCEDYALTKRAKLIKMGWPSGSLLMAVVWIHATSELHAVLIARTDLGEYILDNRLDKLMPLSAMLKAYEFRSIQRVDNPRQWVTFKFNGSNAATSASK